MFLRGGCVDEIHGARGNFSMVDDKYDIAKDPEIRAAMKAERERITRPKPELALVNGGKPSNSKAARASRRLRFECIDKIDLAPVCWLWPDRFPLGKFVLIPGAPDAGKTQLALWIAARVTTGGPWPDDSGLAPRARRPAALQPGRMHRGTQSAHRRRSRPEAHQHVV
jgi:hypothetical protein